ncbi:unnamed protein product, partial [Prorocentrum cordatum]
KHSYACNELYEVPGGDLAQGSSLCQACLLRLPPGRPCARGRAVRWRLEHLLSLQWVESDLLCEYPLLCGAMTTQFCASSTSTLYAMSYPVSSFPSSSWRRRARRLRLAMFRQALFDIHTLQCVPVGMQSPEVVQSPAVVQSPEIRVLEALGVMTESFDGVAKPDGPTDRGKAFSSYSVAYSPDAVQSPDGVLGSVSFLPGVQNEELQGEELQNEDLQSEEVLNEQLHYSHHKDSVDPGVLKEELHDEDSMASHPGSSTTGRLSNAVVSSAVTEDECQAARDWALSGVDVSALWRELHRLPRQEFQRRRAHRLQMGIESSEEDDLQQGGPQSSTSRSALTRSGKKHRKRHR